MRLELEVERTFAGKQYENLKPKLKLSFEDDDTAPDIEKEYGKLINHIENIGRAWQEEISKAAQPGKRKEERTS
jgi:hypothetical protein